MKVRFAGPLPAPRNRRTCRIEDLLRRKDRGEEINVSMILCSIPLMDEGLADKIVAKLNEHQAKIFRKVRRLDASKMEKKRRKNWTLVDFASALRMDWHDFIDIYNGTTNVIETTAREHLGLTRN